MNLREPENEPKAVLAKADIKSIQSRISFSRIFTSPFNPQQNLTNEAQQCINDCRESISTSDFEEELHSASSAVERAELAYSELLEELASRECVDALNEVRKMHAKEEIWSQLRDGIFELRKLLLDDNRGGVDTVNDDVAV
mmetsp:Transcript_33867/g.73269  ORF Transcript_33867/g.73269 Transcript_33867/m.73269 type:complete len:141 (-) Transcript_33867:166-588(-)